MRVLIRLTAPTFALLLGVMCTLEPVFYTEFQRAAL